MEAVKLSDTPSEIDILVVDDNEQNILVMDKILSDLPVNIYHATSGMAALHLAVNHSFAVIFLDVQMPEMDGFETAKHLQKNRKTSKMPIVFVTANLRDKQSELQGYETGAVDYLPKPIDEFIVQSKAKVFMRLFEQQKKLAVMNEELDKLASCDPLTGLMNRYQFNKVLEKIWLQNKRKKTFVCFVSLRFR